MSAIWNKKALLERLLPANADLAGGAELTGDSKWVDREGFGFSRGGYDGHLDLNPTRRPSHARIRLDGEKR